MEELVKKLEKELKDFKVKIKENGVDFAIDKAYELTSKQEMIDYLQFDVELTETEIKALLSRECLLDELYSDWLDFDGNMREDIGYSADRSLNFIMKDFLDTVKKEKKYER